MGQVNPQSYAFDPTLPPGEPKADFNANSSPSLTPNHHFLSPTRLLAQIVDLPGGRALTRKHQRHKCLTLNRRNFCACIIFFKKGPRISRKGDQLLSCQQDFSCLPTPSASFPPPNSQSSSYRAYEENPALLPGILCWVLVVRAEAGASQQSRPWPAGVPLHSQLLTMSTPHSQCSRVFP